MSRKGLNGWFGNLLKKAIKVVVTIIATDIMGPLGPVVGVAFNNAFNNWTADSSFWNVNQKIAPGTQINPDFTGSSTDLSVNEIKNKNLEQWVKTKLTPQWINSFFSDLKSTTNNYNSDQFVKAFNKTLLKLETLRLFYKSETSLNKQGKFASKSIAIDNIDDLIDISEVKTKSEIFSIIAITLRNVVEQEMKSKNYPFFAKDLKGFKAHKYNVTMAPDNLNFSLEATSDIKLYVRDQADNVTVNYNDGSQSSTSGNAETPNTPDVGDVLASQNNENQQPNQGPSFAPNTNTITPQVAQAGVQSKAALVIGGLLVAGYLWNKKKKSK